MHISSNTIVVYVNLNELWALCYYFCHYIKCLPFCNYHFLTNSQYEKNKSLFGNPPVRGKQKTKTFLKLKRISEVSAYGVESWDERLTRQEHLDILRTWWGRELRQWRVKTFHLLCSHSFVHSEKLIGEIRKAITTFNWTNSSHPVTAASRGTLSNLPLHVFFTLARALLLIFTNFRGRLLAFDIQNH